MSRWLDLASLGVFSTPRSSRQFQVSVCTPSCNAPATTLLGSTRKQGL
jgi:hypothetical protein